MAASFELADLFSSLHPCELENQRAGLVETSCGTLSYLKTLLTCPVCYDMIKPSVFQCHHGHSVCRACQAKLVYCPVCRGQFTSVKNLMLSNIAALVKYPCVYAAGGCPEKLYMKLEEEHLKKCPYRWSLHFCKISNCFWSGQLEKLEEHVLSQHGEHYVSYNTHIRAYPVNSIQYAESTVLLIIAGKMFWFFEQWDTRENKVSMTMKYVKPREDAINHYYFQVTIFNAKAEREIRFQSRACDVSQGIGLGENVFDSPNRIVFGTELLWEMTKFDEEPKQVTIYTTIIVEMK